jgi:hypothetical protein
MKASRIAVIAMMLIAVVGCPDLEDPTSVKLEDIIRLDVTGPTSIRADGVSTTTVRATLPEEATNRSVKFTTTRGSFGGTDGKQEITVTASDQGVATATIVAGRDAGVANVTATVGGFITSLQLPYERAFADAMTAETSSAFATKTGATKPVISALLTRQTGNVSLGTPVTFEAFWNGVAVGRFSNITPSDANGRATAIFAADTDDLKTATGDVIIRMSTQTDSGGTLVHELPIRIE